MSSFNSTPKRISDVNLHEGKLRSEIVRQVKSFDKAIPDFQIKSGPYGRLQPWYRQAEEISASTFTLAEGTLRVPTVFLNEDHLVPGTDEHAAEILHASFLLWLNSYHARKGTKASQGRNCTIEAENEAVKAGFTLAVGKDSKGNRNGYDVTVVGVSGLAEKIVKAFMDVPLPYGNPEGVKAPKSPKTLALVNAMRLQKSKGSKKSGQSTLRPETMKSGKVTTVRQAVDNLVKGATEKNVDAMAQRALQNLPDKSKSRIEAYKVLHAQAVEAGDVEFFDFVEKLVADARKAVTA